MDFNDNACCLNGRVVLAFFASRLAPTEKQFGVMSGILCLEKNRKQLGLGCDPLLAVHVFLMDFHGFDGDFQFAGNLLARATASPL